MSTIDPFSPLFPRSNVSGARFLNHPQPEYIQMDNGQQVLAAIPDHPETKTYWMFNDGDDLYHEITRDEAFVQHLYLHFLYGAGMPDESTYAVYIEQGVAEPWGVTQTEMRAAVMAMPIVLDLIVSSGISEQQVWDYTVHEVPWALDLVGVA